MRDSAWLSEADAVIVSFPKSGRTYVRALLARLYQLRFAVDERQLLEFPALRNAPPKAPRVLFTHAGDSMRRAEEIKIDPLDYRDVKLVLLVRHPADIAVSRYHHLKHRSRDRARRKLAEQTLESFVWTEQGGIPAIIAFLNQFAAMEGVTIVRYEDLLGENAEVTLGKLAAAIGLEVAPEEIADALAFASLANLRRLEQDGYFKSRRLRRSKRGDDQSGKVRKGKSGSYRDELTAESVLRIDEYIRANLDARVGYSPA